MEESRLEPLVIKLAGEEIVFPKHPQIYQYEYDLWDHEKLEMGFVQEGSIAQPLPDYHRALWGHYDQIYSNHIVVFGSLNSWEGHTWIKYVWVPYGAKIINELGGFELIKNNAGEPRLQNKKGNSYLLHDPEIDSIFPTKIKSLPGWYTKIVASQRSFLGKINLFINPPSLPQSQGGLYVKAKKPTNSGLFGYFARLFTKQLQEGRFLLSSGEPKRCAAGFDDLLSGDNLVYCQDHLQTPVHIECLNDLAITRCVIFGCLKEYNFPTQHQESQP